ncbi:hypothetical protein GCM10025787_19350 [Saccharopolyspora rosea]|uniref:PE family protein n=1 Tax=Saccharopolyspora rosea TaxID=524884 RepID=A0ABW3FXA4_9PSEU
MTGFGVDPDALRGAVKQLEGIKANAQDLVRNAARVKPGELTADDPSTTRVRQVLQERAVGEKGSLREIANGLVQKLDEKIKAYNDTLREYEAAEEHATVSGRQVDRQA